MNSDETSVYFLISDHKSPPQLIIFNKETEKIEKQSSEINLPLGKIFYQGWRILFLLEEGFTSSTSVENSLFKEHFIPIKKYNSQILMDTHQDQAVSLSTKETHYSKCSSCKWRVL